MCMAKIDKRTVKIIFSGVASFIAGLAISASMGYIISQFGIDILKSAKSFILGVDAVFLPVICFAIGLTIFGIRSYFRALYGCLEIIFGVVSSSFSIVQMVVGNENILSLFPFAIGFFSGLYVIVRGLDNIITGFRN